MSVWPQAATILKHGDECPRAPFGHSYIYALQDPITDEVCYVGRTKNPTSRLRAHGQAVVQCATDMWKRMWTSWLIRNGTWPVMVILSLVPDGEAGDLEGEYIRGYWVAGAPLVNRSKLRSVRDREMAVETERRMSRAKWVRGYYGEWQL